MTYRILYWFFGNRETGAFTIAQAPNLVLWLVIIAGFLSWMVPSSGNLHRALAVVVKGGLCVWAVDEILRGVNPWRRCLGIGVLVYEVWTIWQTA
jgi:hypothetical protein